MKVILLPVCNILELVQVCSYHHEIKIIFVNRGFNSFLKLARHVVMGRQVCPVPGATFFSAKIWRAIAPSAPPPLTSIVMNSIHTDRFIQDINRLAWHLSDIFFRYFQYVHTTWLLEFADNLLL